PAAARSPSRGRVERMRVLPKTLSMAGLDPAIQPACVRAMIGFGVRALLRAQTPLVALALLFVALAGIRLWPHPPLASFKPSSSEIVDDRGRLLRLTLASDDRYRLWVPLREVSPQLVHAVLLHEDRWFYWHPGFNPYGLARGAFVTYVRHGNRQGGSTVTMQLARLLYPVNT